MTTKLAITLRTLSESRDLLTVIAVIDTFPGRETVDYLRVKVVNNGNIVNIGTLFAFVIYLSHISRYLALFRRYLRHLWPFTDP